VKYILKLKPQAWSRTNTMTYASGPVMKYDVEGLPEGQKISVANFCPAGREPVWQIGAHIVGQPTKWTGNFKTAKEALAQLQREPSHEF